MVVDPTQPEKGVFTEFFKIPTSCSCSIISEDQETASTKKDLLLDELMNTMKKDTKDRSYIQTPSKRRKDSDKEKGYSNYDYNYNDDSYFDEETTTSQAGEKNYIMNHHKILIKHILYYPSNTFQKYFRYFDFRI